MSQKLAAFKRVMEARGTPVEQVSSEPRGTVLRILTDGKTIRFHENRKPCVMAIERNDRMAFEDQDFYASAHEIDGRMRCALIPSPIASHAFRARRDRHWAEDPTHRRDNPVRVVRFDRDPEAEQLIPFIIGSIEDVASPPQSAPPISFGGGDRFIVLEMPDRRGYCGTLRDCCQQMFAEQRFTNDPTLEAWIAGCLARLGLHACPPIPELLLGAWVARGHIEIYPPGCRIAPSVDGL